MPGEFVLLAAKIRPNCRGYASDWRKGRELEGIDERWYFHPPGIGNIWRT